MHVRDLRRIRRAGWIALLAFWIAGVLVIYAAGAGNTAAQCWTPIAILGVTSLLMARRPGVPFVGEPRVAGRGSFAVGDGVLEIRAGDAAHRFSCADLTDGWIELGREGEVLILHTRSGVEITIGGLPPGGGGDLLRSLGLHPEQRVVTMRVAAVGSALQRTLATFFAVCIGVLALLAGLGSVVSLSSLSSPDLHSYSATLLGGVLNGLLALGAGYAVWRLSRHMITTTLRIGSDGVKVTRLLRRRLIPRARIELVWATPYGLSIALRGSGDVQIPMPPLAAQAVATSIGQVFHRPASGVPAASLTLLDRGDRPLGAWLSELRALGRGAGAYRERAVDRDALLDRVQDGAAAPAQRIAAAVVLGGSADPPTRAALRVAAAACVDERTRAALDRASEGEVEAAAIEEAMRRSARA